MEDVNEQFNNVKEQFDKEPTPQAFGALGGFIRNTIQNAMEAGLKQAMSAIQGIKHNIK